MPAAVSIIVPVYNTERYLEACLDSLLRQTYADIEIICVDDCSIDASLAILNTYAKSDKRLKIIKNTERQGVSVCRNAGMQAASGRFLMFVDSDDFIELCAVETLLNKMDESLDLILFNGRIFTACDSIDFFAPERVDMVSRHSSFKAVDRTHVLRFTNAATSFIRKSFLEEHGISFVPMFFEDWDFMWHVYSFNPTIRFVDEPLYHYRKNVINSITYDIKSQKSFDLLKAFDNGMAYFTKARIFNAYEYSAYFIGFEYLYGLIPTDSFQASRAYIERLREIARRPHPLMLRAIICNKNLLINKHLFAAIEKNADIAVWLLLPRKIMNRRKEIYRRVHRIAVRYGIEKELAGIYYSGLARFVMAFCGLVGDALFLVPYLSLKMMRTLIIKALRKYYDIYI